MNHLFATKSVEDLQKDAASATEGSQHGPGPVTLRRVLGPIGLTAIGVGAIIGSGIFVMTGRVAAQEAGPGIMVSFIIAGIACCLAALCYAELAAMVPAAGSAYSYAYATLGELLAWIIGWDLILEYAMACSTVAVGWSFYANQLLYDLSGVRIPDYLVSDPWSTPGAWFNLPAILITGLLTVVLLIGVRESATTNAVLVAVKVGVVLLVILAGMWFINPAFYTTVPPGERITTKQKTFIGEAAAEYAGAVLPDLDKSAPYADRTARKQARDVLTKDVTKHAIAVDRLATVEREAAALPKEQGEARIARGKELYGPDLPKTTADIAAVGVVLPIADQLNERYPAWAAEAAEAHAKETKADAKAAARWAGQAVATDRLSRVRLAVADATEAGRLTKEQGDAVIAAAQPLYRAPNDEELKAIAAGTADYGAREATSPEDRQAVGTILPAARKLVEANPDANVARTWGLLGTLGLHRVFVPLDEKIRSPFFPYGLSGVIFGASLVFFAYIGFDAVSTHAEEAVNPQRNVPIGILASLLLCTVLYIAVAAVLTGMREYQTIPPKAAVATVFSDMQKWWGTLIAILVGVGGLAGMTSVLLISFQSQSRIFLAMARDGLLPKAIFSTLHPTFRTPYISIILIGIGIGGVAAFTPISVLEEMVNIGTLLAFSIVCGAVLLLRIRRPETERPFRTPLVWVVAPLGIAANVILMLFLPLETWLRLVVWLGIGLAIYFSFGYWNSRVGRELRTTTGGA